MTTSAYRMRRRERRGVILILVLGVLGLMAVIGVTFATFTGQSRIASRSFAQSKVQPQSEQLMDFALSQLISDTNDTRSAIRGHSLARDMYGNDSNRNGFLERRPDGARAAPADDAFLYITRISAGALPNQYVVTTNIAEGDPAFYGYNFLRWTIRVAYVGGVAAPVTGVIGQTFEVVADGGFVSGSSDPRLLTVVVAPTDATTVLASATHNTITPASLMLADLDNDLGARFRFILDGRWLHAFNGPGKTSNAKYGNYRYNVLDQPGQVGMDEDYDAVDLENWFLAMQSADGQLIIPSFHRPANIRYPAAGFNDWEGPTRESLSRIIRPRAADGHDPATFPDLIPGADGRITYDVDNDGDGITDSVWVDLGYPARRNAQGTLYKPLFAFMVVGLNGRIPLNTAGNLAGRASGEESNATHASHLGNSVSEVDPTYGLQNGFAPGYAQADVSNLDVRLTQLRGILAGTRPQADPNVPDTTGQVNGDVDLVQMGWNDLAMTIPRWTSLPNGKADAGDVDSAGNSPPVAPNPVVRMTTPVAGRWGEPDSVPGGSYAPLGADYSNEVRPGYSMSVSDYNTAMMSGNPPIPADAADDDFNSFDAFPPRMTGEVGDSDFYDAAGGLLLPVERMRRFLTPVDLNGSGSVSRWNSRGGGGNGGDYWGRVEYRGYYRPPGLPGQVDPATGQIVYPWVDGDPYPGGMASLANVTSRLAHNNNILHGYEAYLNPNTRGRPQRSGGMLAYQDSSVVPPTIGTPTRMPTYDNKINSGIDYTYSYTDDSGNPVNVAIDSRSDGLNEADELNLYKPNPNLDSPFSHADLEWLYRRHDVDGGALGSRLASLAPISFLNDVDGLRRRRLFAIESWESNAYAWTNDNPAYAFDRPLDVPPHAAGDPQFPENRRFASPAANANMATISPTTYTPALAQRGRKINLNMPLPVSNDPNEPIRRKWITDAYQLLKTVLPPRSVDTPEELAQLGQYLVNLIDFRDPDCTMTKWVNPDVYFVPVGMMTPTPNVLPALSFTAMPGASLLEHYGMEYNPVAINEVLAYSYNRKEGVGTGRPTGRFFVELVNTLTKPETGAALNNAGQINLSGFGSNPTAPYAGACWDLIFTEDTPGSRPDPYMGQLQPGASVRSMTPLSSAAFTPAADAVLNPLPRQRGGTAVDFFGSVTDPKYIATIANRFPGTAPEIESETMPVGANLPGTANLLTLADAYDPVNAIGVPTITMPPGGVLPRPITGPTAPPTFPPKIEETGPAPLRTQGEARYYWVCLRRPANPMAPVTADNPMIVVDSMRFPYVDVGGTVRTEATDDPAGSGRVDIVTQGDNDIYSYQRIQPYRGGQAVPVIGAVAGNIDPRYGFTEQIAAPITTLNGQIVYGTDDTQRSGSNRQVSRSPIYHTLGRPNDGSVDLTTGVPLEYWDFFPFHDRDFTSPFELTLVPGVAPGLFTKHFAEFAPSATSRPGFVNAAAGLLTTSRFSLRRPVLANTAGPIATAEVAQPFVFPPPGTNPVQPHTFPYLVDKFFYTAAGSTGLVDVLYDAGTLQGTVGGYASDGWFKMFELFEVPSQMAGAIGTVAQGTNFDWARQDLRAGQLNLNLIIDEEVFLALLGKQDMSGAVPTFLQQRMNPYMVPLAADVGLSSFDGGVWPGPLAIGYPTIPMVVTGTLDNGAPAYAFPMTNVGTVAPHPVAGGISNRMKAAFAQFLWARHGGSGFLFGFGEGITGQNTAITPPTPPVNSGDANYLTQIPAERPFRSLSYPDVDATSMRPASLPPSFFSDPVVDPATTNDPGVRNWALFPGYNRSVGPISTPATPALPPAIPTRRLFQIPDGSATSNASVLGDDFINRIRPAGAGNPTIGGLPPVVTVASGSPVNLNDGATSLFIPQANTPTGYPEISLGRGGGGINQTQHPYFRGELMQRVMNLTTVRTHQFAVWITVGFFEVKREGDIAMIGDPTYPQAAFDILGPEIGASTAENTRYRSFFVVDRLKLTGFDPDSMGAYQAAVLYRRTIE